MPHRVDGNYNEADLIARARRFDRGAISALYRMHVESIYRYVYVRVTDTHIAEDITSDVFLRALEGLESFEYRGIPFSAWLYRIARDRVVDHYRRSSKHVAAELDENIVAADHGPDLLVLKSLDREALRDALELLTEEQRLVVIMRFLDGEPTAEVARRLGKTEGSIKALQRRALAALGRVLGGEQGD